MKFKSLLLLALVITALFSLAACSALPSGIVAKKDCVYVSGQSLPAQSLDLFYRPEGKPLPLVVWIHGGGWLAGDKKDCQAEVLLRNGFAFASLNYRFSNQAPFPAQIHDCKAAIRWLRAHAKEYNLDPNRIGVWGASAGGHLSALLGTTGGVKQLEGRLGNPEQSSSVSAVCDWCGPTDFLTIAAQEKPNSQLHAGDPSGIVAKFLGGVPSPKLRAAQDASPCTFVSPDDPPMLVVHGDADDIVPVEQSIEFAEKLKAKKVPCQLSIVKGGTHSFYSPERMNEALQFFQLQLKP